MLPQGGARNKEDVDMGQEDSGRPEADHSARVASTHYDTQARLKLISGREHCEDTRKASTLGGVFLDSTVSPLIKSERSSIGISTRWTYHC